MRTVTLGGITLDLLDDVSTRIVEEMTGWDDAPAVRSGLQPRAGQSGAWDAAGVNAERVVDINGWVQEPTMLAAKQVQQDLAGLRPGATTDLIVLYDGLGSMSAATRVTIGVKFEDIDDRSFGYSVQVTAPDPVKYGAPTFGTATLSEATPGAGRIWPRVWPTDYGIPPGVTPGAVMVGNVGNAHYWPTLRIDGPVTNPQVSLVESGAWVQFTGHVATGQWLNIDLQSRDVLLNGVESMRHLVTSSGDWLAVPPGGGSVAWTANSVSPNAFLSVMAYEGAWA